MPGRLLKKEAQQRNEREGGKTEKHDGTDPPFAIVVLFHLRTSHCSTNALTPEGFRHSMPMEQRAATSGFRR